MQDIVGAWKLNLLIPGLCAAWISAISCGVSLRTLEEIPACNYTSRHELCACRHVAKPSCIVGAAVESKALPQWLHCNISISIAELRNPSVAAFKFKTPYVVASTIEVGGLESDMQGYDFQVARGSMMSRRALLQIGAWKLCRSQALQ